MMCDPIADAACELLSFHGVVTARYISLLPVRQCATCHQPIATTTSQAASTVTAASKSKECVCVAVWFCCFLSRCSFILRLSVCMGVCLSVCIIVCCVEGALSPTRYRLLAPISVSLVEWEANLSKSTLSICNVCVLRCAAGRGCIADAHSSHF
jgi:hypothetical protein